MSSRKRSISLQIASILLLPLLSLLALSVLAASHAFGRSWATLDAVAAVGGVLAMAASIAVAVPATRRIMREVRGLTAGVYDFSHRRLPMISERVRQGVETHGGFDAPNYSFDIKEVEKLYGAFVAARDAAVAATVDEATVRRGLGEVFVNLARRSQALVHRQLSLLDGMERRAAEPEELEDLFRLDHLATRMRRHAEGLVILSGRAPARGWRNPVPCVDVARGAVAEVEDYTRIVVAPMPGTALTGRAVADVIHLLAELIENATSFSPPHTSVQVTGQIVGNGFAFEVEDRGLGLDAEHLEAINALLADPPEFDLTESSRLGLFVVGHLARRQGLRVSLRPSPYGGTTAIVLVPSALIADAGATPEQATAAAVGASSPTQPQPAITADTAPAAASTSTASSATGHLRPAPAGTPAGSRPQDARTPSLRAPGRHALVSASSGRDGRDGGDQSAGPQPTEDELPKRVRQESLAPELRGEPSVAAGGAAGGPAGDQTGAADTERSPEEVRATMAALQNGWLRGRDEGAAEDDSTSPGQRSRWAQEENT